MSQRVFELSEEEILDAIGSKIVELYPELNGKEGFIKARFRRNKTAIVTFEDES